MADTLTLRLLRILPKNLISRAFGFLASRTWPRWFARWSIRTFRNKFDIDLTDAVRPVEEYESLVDFFTRRLRAEARPIAPGEELVVSPVDGDIGVAGKIEGDTLYQAKGMAYSAAALLGSEEQARRFDGGTFITLYLSPRDYHRIHAPVAGGIAATLYEPGTLWPVNPPAVRTVPSLFAVNERVTSLIETPRGPVAVVMVGATNVGRIRVAYQDLVSNSGGKRAHERHDPAIAVEKGGDLGCFEMGSTVVLLIADPNFVLDELPEWVAMGSRIGAAPHDSSGQRGTDR